MSRIYELVDELCPDGVSFFELGEVSEIKRGTSITKTAVVDGDVPVIAGGRTPAYFHNESNRDGQTIVIAGSGAYAGFVSWWDQPIFVSDAFSIKVSESITAKYCYYWLQSMQVKLHELKSGGGVPHVYPRDVFPLRIPVPPLEVQLEIVKILDAFTELEAELLAELEARQKQYQYYRDKLLRFEGREDVRWEKLGSMTTITIGEFVHKNKQDSTAKYPVYNGGTSPTGFYDQFNNSGNKIIVSARGANAGFVNRIASPYWAGNSCYSIGVNETGKLNWDYAYHYLKYSERKLIGEQQKGGIPAVSKKQVEELIMPVPPIYEQVRIVQMLDNFDALVNDISVGLPAEIAARRKQYEYYRDRLLSFKEAA